MSQKKIKLKDELRLMIPRLSGEANKLRDKEARSRWMIIRRIVLSPKSIVKVCAQEGVSVDWFEKWGKRLLKFRRLIGLYTKSKKPHRSPNKTKPYIEKKVLKIRRAEPYLGPERISDLLNKIYSLNVPASTVFSILKRAQIVSKKTASKLTKKHTKRYRRMLPGYLQMDFKYVPFLIENKQYYQLSCVDHHSGWRLIRCYRRKNLRSVLQFLSELKSLCPFPIIEIQTDNDTSFTDKFSSQVGVTGEHGLDVWCQQHGIIHRLIPVGVKELNGKVENTHKQDDREFFAVNNFTTYKSIEKITVSYNERWNNIRATKTLGWKTPNQVIEDAYVKVLALMMYIKNDKNTAIYNLNTDGDLVLPIPKNKKVIKIKNKTRKITAVDKYLQYLEWLDKNKLNCLTFIQPTITQSFSSLFTS